MQKAAGKKQNVAEVLKQMAEREQLLRTIRRPMTCSRVRP